MAGIYIHIPFCRQKCHYCNFFSLASRKQMDAFVSALLDEIRLTADYLGDEPVTTVYIGGGTPSLIHPDTLNRIVDSIKNIHRFPLLAVNSPSETEWTIELNPEDVTPAYAAGLTRTPFNRFSLGVQSFSDSDLHYLNRSHSAAQARQAVSILNDHGFNSLNIDLIYGIPSSEENQWEKNIETAFSMGIPHISAYALTVEPRTPLEWMIRKNKYAPVDETCQVIQFRQLINKARKAGFEQYEISNFALPGHHAIHNSNYWNGTPYLGLGPSAHSYDGQSRRWNRANLSEYIRCIHQREVWYESESLSVNQRYNEYVMTSLRTMWGCHKDVLISDFGTEIAETFTTEAEVFISKGWIAEKEAVYYLTDEGKLFADGISSALFITE